MYIKINTATRDQNVEAWRLSKSHGNFKQKKHSYLYFIYGTGWKVPE